MLAVHQSIVHMVGARDMTFYFRMTCMQTRNIFVFSKLKHSYTLTLI
jgi:hypothetical protein